MVSPASGPEHRVLDIGSGIGNLAIGLLDHLRGGYDGVEIHAEAVCWCQETITSRYPAFRFHRADVSSGAYNAEGRQSASAYRFPFADSSFDFIMLGSVFTHMLPDEVRALRAGNRASPDADRRLRRQLLPDQRRSARGVRSNRSFMSFESNIRPACAESTTAAVPEARGGVRRAFVTRIHDQAGLGIQDIRRGRWWSGESHDQDVLTVVTAGNRQASAPRH